MPEGKSFEEMLLEESRVLQKYAKMKEEIQIAQMLVESLEKNGATATLQLLISISAVENTEKLNDMIAMFSSMVNLGKFLKKIPSYEVDEKTFEHLLAQPGFL